MRTTAKFTEVGVIESNFLGGDSALEADCQIRVGGSPECQFRLECRFDAPPGGNNCPTEEILTELAKLEDAVANFKKLLDQ